MLIKDLTFGVKNNQVLKRTAGFIHIITESFVIFYCNNARDNTGHI